MASMKEYRGDNVVIDLYQDADVIAYRMAGQSIAEQAGTTRMSEEDLLAVLLDPIGLKVVNGKIVSQDWGGARPGAGRKPLSDEQTIESTITLPAGLDAKAKRLGAGNRSAGIRRALDAWEEDV